MIFIQFNGIKSIGLFIFLPIGERFLKLGIPGHTRNRLHIYMEGDTFSIGDKDRPIWANWILSRIWNGRITDPSEGALTSTCDKLCCQLCDVTGVLFMCETSRDACIIMVHRDNVI